MSIDPRAVELRLPADPRRLRVARVTAAAVAVDLPFTVTDIDDVRVAVDELAAAAIEGAPPGSVLELRLAVEGDGLVVEGRVAGGGPLVALHPVAADLLALVTDEHELVDVGGDRVFRFTKCLGASAAAGPGATDS